MKRLSLLTLLFCALTTLSAQPPQRGGGQFRPQGPTITGKISGMLLDSVSRTPIEFATVVLIDPRQDQQIDGTVTDEQGNFKLSDIKNGVYHLRIDFLGYEPRTVTGVELTLEKPDVNLGDLFLSPESLLLEEVTVTGERAVIENKIDKIVYNADKDLTTQGGDATDVLQRVPLLAVDIEGNVSLRGSNNVQILINGKPSTIFSSGSLADALKTFPADQIKAVEVITSPSAKYDGEGTAGIINIVTKKKSIEGFTGSINASAGTRSNRGSLNLNYARGRFGLNANLSGWYNVPRDSYNDFLRESYADSLGVGLPTVLDQSTDGESNFYGPRGSISAFYDINAFNSLTSSVTFRGFGRNNEGFTNSFFDNPTDNLEEQVYTRDNLSRSLRSGFDWTTDYRKTFKTPEQELVFALQLSGDLSTARNEILQEGNFSFLNRDEVNENDGLNLEYTFQTDYTHPFSKAVKMETGAKAVIRRIDSDFRFRFRDFDTNEYIVDPNQTDIFFYDQDVFAGYLSFNINLGDKYGLIAGARYEHTTIAGRFSEDPTTFTNNYDNILPSIILSRKLNQFSSLKVSFSQRIQRPSLRFINPYVDISDPRDISFGNPQVLPELTDQYELSYNTYIKGVVFNAALYFRNTSDEISNITTVEDDITVTTFQNIGRERSLGFNMFTSFNLKKWLTLRGGFDLRRFEAEGLIRNILVSRSAYIWRGNLNGTVDMGKGFKMEMFGFFNSPSQTLQGSRGSYSQFSFGVNKEMFNNRGSLGLSIIQPFSRNLAFPAEIQGQDFSQISEFGVEVRSFNINFNYRFGKLDFKQQRRRRSTINNNDLKQGGDDGNF